MTSGDEPINARSLHRWADTWVLSISPCRLPQKLLEGRGELLDPTAVRVGSAPFPSP